MQTCWLFNTDFIGFDISPLAAAKSLGLIVSTQSIFRPMAPETNEEQTIHLLLLLGISVRLSLKGISVALLQSF